MEGGREEGGARPDHRLARYDVPKIKPETGDAGVGSSYGGRRTRGSGLMDWKASGTGPPSRMGTTAGASDDTTSWSTIPLNRPGRSQRRPGSRSRSRSRSSACFSRYLALLRVARSIAGCPFARRGPFTLAEAAGPVQFIRRSPSLACGPRPFDPAGHVPPARRTAEGWARGDRRDPWVGEGVTRARVKRVGNGSDGREGGREGAVSEGVWFPYPGNPEDTDEGLPLEP